jgi:hypothetical protein
VVLTPPRKKFVTKPHIKERFFKNCRTTEEELGGNSYLTTLLQLLHIRTSICPTVSSEVD